MTMSYIYVWQFYNYYNNNACALHVTMCMHASDSVLLQTMKIVLFVLVACFAIVNCQSSTQINCLFQEVQRNPALGSCVTMFGVSSCTIHACNT